MIDNGRGDKMRDFDTLDTNSFKAFWTASETLNFTLAAKNAGLTQSGISQHISRLEKQLGVPLFERVNKKVFLTEAGKMLRSYVDEYLDQMEQLKEKIKTQSVSLSGTVAYAMPASCLMTAHLSQLLKKRAEDFPNVKFNVSICSNNEVTEKILNQEIQFGFITKKINHPGLKLTPYCSETYVLIGSSKASVDEINAKTLKTRSFVHHPGVDVHFEHWRQFHFPKANNLTWDALDIAGTVNSLSGAISMVEGGVGLTIVPKHCAESQLAAGTVIQHETKENMTNTIYLVTLEGAQQPRRIVKVMEVFMEMVAKK